MIEYQPTVLWNIWIWLLAWSPKSSWKNQDILIFRIFKKTKASLFILDVTLARFWHLVRNWKHGTKCCWNRLVKVIVSRFSFLLPSFILTISMFCLLKPLLLLHSLYPTFGVGKTKVGSPLFIETWFRKTFDKDKGNDDGDEGITQKENLTIIVAKKSEKILFAD